MIVSYSLVRVNYFLVVVLSTLMLSSCERRDRTADVEVVGSYEINEFRQGDKCKKQADSPGRESPNPYAMERWKLLITKLYAKEVYMYDTDGNRTLLRNGDASLRANEGSNTLTAELYKGSTPNNRFYVVMGERGNIIDHYYC